MIKKISLFVVTCAMTLFITACNSTNAGLSKNFMTVDELNDFMENGTGFIFVTSEIHSEDYQAQKQPVESALQENNESAFTFNVYMKDGKTIEDRDINPYGADELKINALNYIENGQLVEAFQLSKYDGYDILQSLNEFVKNTAN